MALDRASILSAQDIKTKTVSVPEWGGDINIRTLSGSARDAASKIFTGGDKGEGSSMTAARVIALCAVDDEGKPLFTGDEDVKLLVEKSNVALTRVFQECLEVNGLGAKAVAAAKKD